MTNRIKKIKIGDIFFSIFTDDEIIEHIDFSLKNSEKTTIAQTNAHFVVEAGSNERFRQAIDQYTLVQPDGVGIYLALKTFYKKEYKNPEIQTGTEFYYKLFEYLDQNSVKVFIIGSTEERLSKMSAYLKHRYKKMNIVGMHHGYFSDQSPELLTKLKSSGPDVLLIGMGVPRQELWLQANIANINVPVSLTVGAGLEFISRTKRRAPILLRTIGLEWAFRLIQEPGRLWKRYLIGIPKYLGIILKMKIRKSQ